MLDIRDETRALLTARVDILFAIYSDDEEYATIKSALKDWKVEDGWTEALDDAAAKSRKIWACLIGLPEAFGSQSNAYIVGQQSGMIDHQTAVDYVRTLFYSCYTEDKSRDEILQAMIDHQNYVRSELELQKKMARDEAATEPGFYAAGDIMHIWEKYLSTGSQPFFIVPSGSGTTSVSSLTEAEAVQTETPNSWTYTCLHDCAVVANPPLLRLICQLGICVIGEEQELISTLKTAVSLITKIGEAPTDENALRRLLVAFHVGDAHWVLGTLDISSCSDGWSGELRFLDPLNGFIKVPPKLDPIALGLSKLNVVHQRGATQQHDMCSSGPIVAANGLDYLKLGKGIKKPALDRIYDYGARPLRDRFLNECNVRFSEVDGDVPRMMYYMFSSMLVIVTDSTDWGPVLESWMIKKSIEAQADREGVSFESEEDLEIAARLYQEMDAHRVNEIDGDRLDAVVMGWTFSSTPSDPDGVRFNEHNMRVLAITDFTLLAALRSQEDVDRKEVLRQRYSDVFDTLTELQNEFEDKMAALDENEKLTPEEAIEALDAQISKKETEIQDLQEDKVQLETDRAGVEALMEASQSSTWSFTGDVNNAVADFEQQLTDLDAQIDVRTEKEKKALQDTAQTDRIDQYENKIKDLEVQKAKQHEQVEKHTKAANDYEAEANRIRDVDIPASSQALTDAQAVVSTAVSERDEIQNIINDTDAKIALAGNPSAFKDQNGSQLDQLKAPPPVPETEPYISTVETEQRGYFQENDIVTQKQSQINAKAQGIIDINADLYGNGDPFPSEPICPDGAKCRNAKQKSPKKAIYNKRKCNTCGGQWSDGHRNNAQTLYDDWVADHARWVTEQQLMRDVEKLDDEKKELEGQRDAHIETRDSHYKAMETALGQVKDKCQNYSDQKELEIIAKNTEIDKDLNPQVTKATDQHNDDIQAETDARANAATARERAANAQALEDAISADIKEIEDKIAALDISPGLTKFAA